MNAKEVRQELKRFMKERRISQADYARLAGTGRSQVSHVLSGRKTPGDKVLRPIRIQRITQYERY